MANNEYTVELRPHIGTRNTPFGPVEVEHDQWYVIASRGGKDPKQVGYMNKLAGKVLFLAGVRERCGKFICDQIEAAAAEEFAKKTAGTLPRKGGPYPSNATEAK